MISVYLEQQGQLSLLYMMIEKDKWRKQKHKIGHVNIASICITLGERELGKHD